MKIVSVADRELTNEEIASMKQFRSYTDGVSFACLKEGVMAMLHDEPSKDPRDLKAAALARMEEALSCHPDMTTYHMDDGCKMVCLNVGVFAFTDAPCEDAGFELWLLLRGLCLEACELGDVIAVAYEED